MNPPPYIVMYDGTIWGSTNSIIKARETAHKLVRMKKGCRNPNKALKLVEIFQCVQILQVEDDECQTPDAPSATANPGTISPPAASDSPPPAPTA